MCIVPTLQQYNASLRRVVYRRSKMPMNGGLYRPYVKPEGRYETVARLWKRGIGERMRVSIVTNDCRMRGFQSTVNSEWL